MLTIRNLLGVGIAVVLMLALTTAGAFAQPMQQATATPEATVTVEATQVVTPTETLTPTLEPSPTSVAPAVSPLATPEATPATLPTTGGSSDGTAGLSLLALGIGAVLILGALGLAWSRRAS